MREIPGLSGAGDVSGNPSAFLAGQGHVSRGGRGLLIGVARDGSGAGGTAQRLAVSVVGNEAERLSGVVRRGTRLTHSNPPISDARRPRRTGPRVAASVM